MDKDNKLYKAYVEILKRELVPAMGCTEPIAIAYCAAKAREALFRHGGVNDLAGELGRHTLGDGVCTTVGVRNVLSQKETFRVGQKFF